MSPTSGATRWVIESALAAIRNRIPAALAVVVETSGSTYVQAGAIALFPTHSSQVGWLSGGCLEPEIARRAESAANRECVEWMEIDSRDDEDLFSGSAVGCRGRLRLALLPVLAMDGWKALADAWIDGSGALVLRLDASGQLECRIGDLGQDWNLQASVPDWEQGDGTAASWTIALAEPPAVLIFGAGPEIPLLVPMLRSLGWMTWIVESRSRWQIHSELADHRIHQRPASAMALTGPVAIRAALVMQHSFELDREALLALAMSSAPFVGLLGPLRRRDDLLKVLPGDIRDTLLPRLHSPIGLDLGGHGPEAIALSIAAQLQAWLHRR